MSEFAIQTAKQYNHVMITRHALTSIKWRGKDDKTLPVVNARSEGMTTEGKYVIDMSNSSWGENTISLHDHLVKFYLRKGKEISRDNKSETQTVTGCTQARCIDENGIQAIFYVHHHHGLTVHMSTLWRMIWMYFSCRKTKNCNAGAD